MTWRRNLLWLDGLGGAAVGVLMLLTAPLLSTWYQLPRGFLLLMGTANLAYGIYALSLARRAERPLGLIVLLALANGTWAALCAGWAFRYRETASVLGLLHLVVEGLYVGGLGLLEWRWRAHLCRA